MASQNLAGRLAHRLSELEGEALTASTIPDLLAESTPTADARPSDGPILGGDAEGDAEDLAPVQDDQREQEMRQWLNLERPPNATRAGTDAVFPCVVPSYGRRLLPFELKSTTDETFATSTARDVGDKHLEKWRTQHWLFGRYETQDGVRRLVEIRYGAPDRMAGWIDELDTALEPLRQNEAIVGHLLRTNPLVRRAWIELLREVPTVETARPAASAPIERAPLMPPHPAQTATVLYDPASRGKIRHWMETVLRAKGLSVVKYLGFKKGSTPTKEHVAANEQLFGDWLASLTQLQMANGRMMNCPRIPGTYITELPALDMTSALTARTSLEVEVRRWLERHQGRPALGLGLDQEEGSFSLFDQSDLPAPIAPARRR